jgi:hypothetical protein
MVVDSFMKKQYFTQPPPKSSVLEIHQHHLILFASTPVAPCFAADITAMIKAFVDSDAPRLGIRDALASAATMVGQSVDLGGYLVVSMLIMRHHHNQSLNLSRH